MPQNILVLATDIYDISAVLRIILMDSYNVTYIQDINKALDELSKRGTDILIINSRQRDGDISTKLLKKIRLLYSNIPILVTLESQDRYDMQEFKDAGASETIDVPFLKEELLNKIDKIRETKKIS